MTRSAPVSLTAVRRSGVRKRWNVDVELMTLLLRTLFMYFFVLIMLRLMGKREIGKLSVFDLVISIMIAEIAVIAIERVDQPLWVSVAPVFLLVLTQMGLAFLSLKNRRIRLLIDGRPSVLIRDGKLNWREMRKQRYTLDDLASQLRESRTTDVENVRLAVLEPSGRLSVIPKESSGEPGGRGEPPETEASRAEKTPEPGAFRPEETAPGSSRQSREHEDAHRQGRDHADASRPGRELSEPFRAGPAEQAAASRARAGERGGSARTPEQGQPKMRFELLPLPLIMDGQVQEDNLARIGKTRFWLKRELKQHGINRFKDVFYCSVDHRGKLFVDRKD